MRVRIGAFFLVMTLLMAGGCSFSSKPNEPVQISWYMAGDDVELYNRLKGILAIEKATGVDVVFECPPNNSEDAYKMMVASGQLPDVIMWSRSAATMRMFEEGTILDLTELIEQHAPNLMKLYTERPELRKQVETAEGRLYYFPSINPLQTMEEICRQSYQGFIIRKDWLDNLGLQYPTSIDAWYEVLTAFKHRDPNGNGYQDEIPYDGQSLYCFAPAFGVLNTFCVKLDGTVAFGPMEPEYKTYLATMNKWYSEGLLGSNCLIHSAKWMSENITSNLTGAFLGLENAWRYELPNIRQTAANAELLAVPWVSNITDGNRYTPMQSVATNIRSIVTVITSSCKNPEAAVKFIDYMYSEEGSSLLTWGIEGESWVWQDGRKVLTEAALAPDPEKGWISLYNYAIGHSAFPKYDGETVVLASYPEDQLMAERVWADGSTALIYPPCITLSVNDQAYCDNVMNDVNNYIAEMELKFITGEESLDNFDRYVMHLDKMGVTQVLDIYRRAYEAYRTK
ncbi:MAG: extracellular solute-binding protein [Aristaeellaceae bacterium]